MGASQVTFSTASLGVNPTGPGQTPYSGNGSGSNNKNTPSVHLLDSGTRDRFFRHLDIAEKIAKESATEVESPSAEPNTDSCISKTRPAYQGKKEIPAAMSGSCIATGAQTFRSGAAMTFTVANLAGLHTGEAISTLGLAVLGIVATLFNLITAANKISDNSSKEQTLNAVLIRNRAQARAFFDNCELGKKSTAEEAQAYRDFIGAASQHEKFSEKAPDSTFIAQLMVAKEAAYVAISGINVAQLVIAISAVPVAALATMVLSALSIGLGFVANAYDIVQGWHGLVAANQKRETALGIRNSLQKIFGANNEKIDPKLSDSLVSFFESNAKVAENEAAFSILRIAKGLAGMLIAGLGAVLLVMSGGAAAPVAAILGVASSFIWFLGLMAKVVMDIKKFNADQVQKEAYMALVNSAEAQAFISETSMDYSNHYMMVRKFAEAIVDGSKMEKDVLSQSIFSAMGFDELDIKLLEGMHAMEGPRMEKINSVEIFLRNKMGINF